jgi:hypothetical protein
MKALDKSPENPIALRWLAIVEYEDKNYKKSLAYLKRLQNISKFHIFYPQIYDVRAQEMITKAYRRMKNPIQFGLQYFKLTLYIYRNRKNKKQSYLV